ncbi:MAG: bifunctional diaminohydroxyphosphoribosylaminopyrimidine deaminase/5-amino-6-(5-phosphoribosylamino)uracil reductase RibD [Omnitrophica bacterium]|nr:bifunctional diaminohydroxyphosphoribosylaminopyrimidine deaminase/5-amino-6-(5-phosphoribosylamino)uracil reductase RibD [Candidatus Omnitrophota bacterium]
MKVETHKRFMLRAIELAKKAEGKTFPNPMVGAVIVKNGKVIGEGYHRRAGGPHAEIAALRKAKKNTRGALLYVNLEPCAHYGRTPPCTKSLAKRGIRKVYAAMKDPNPMVNGKGLCELKKDGIEIKLGLCLKEARKLNTSYIMRVKGQKCSAE